MIDRSGTKSAKQSKSKTLNPEEVAEFLKNNSDFFVNRDDLLLTLTLPHQRGDTISLVERQIALLRERNLDYRHHLNNLSVTAHDNEQTFQRMRQLVLALLESRDLDQVIEVMHDSLAHDFAIDIHSLVLFSEKPMSLPVRVEHVDVATATLGDMVSKGKAISGRFSDEQVAFLFPEQTDDVGSVAIIPLSYALNDPTQLGVLALASKDPKHFQAGMGTEFIQYLGDVLSRVLVQHKP
ncbi:hypothetical protein ACH42_07670 [Endozoicomonas sp. (ex Bugula neritina AB1)]|nr:hypothetical protein ACH42_07670 [Endozoicomonas sp. (ex Bugula neritina AB1)]